MHGQGKALGWGWGGWDECAPSYLKVLEKCEGRFRTMSSVLSENGFCSLIWGVFMNELSFTQVTMLTLMLVAACGIVSLWLPKKIEKDYRHHWLEELTTALHSLLLDKLLQRI